MRKGIVFITVLLFIIAMVGCEFSISTAKITEAVPCKAVDAHKKPISPQDTFSTSDKAIFVSLKAENVPSGTKVHMHWYYEGAEVGTYTAELDESMYLESHLYREEGLLPGTYEAEFYIDDREKPDQTIKVVVE